MEIENFLQPQVLGFFFFARSGCIDTRVAALCTGFQP
jgi:hypothetical protein